MSLIKVKGSSITGALAAVDGSALTGLSGGITHADIWDLSSTQTVSSGLQTFTAWQRQTSRSREPEGSAMTESSGLFTFPTTGKWLISANFYTDGYQSTHYCGVILRNGNDENLQISYSQGKGSNPSWEHAYLNVQTFLDVTDTTSNDCKVYFKTDAGGARTWGGHASNGKSCALFIRLMDT